MENRLSNVLDPYPGPKWAASRMDAARQAKGRRARSQGFGGYFRKRSQTTGMTASNSAWVRLNVIRKVSAAADQQKAKTAATCLCLRR